MAKAVNSRTKVVFITNPNNPTGTWLTHQAVRAFLQKIPASVIVFRRSLLRICAGK